MADIFLTEDVRKLFLNKFVVVMGGSVHRSIYKDLVMLLQKNKYLSDSQLRAKGEHTFQNDQLLEGGNKGKMKTDNNFREVRQYKTNHHLVRFYFLTRCYNNYVEAVLKTLSQDPRPDVVIISTILWDITRYGDTGVVQYKKRLLKFFDRIKQTMTDDCLIIWNTAPPVSKEAKGGIFTPEVEHLRSTFRLEVLEANYYAYKTAVAKGYNVLDLHYFLRLQLHRRAEDGIHWDMTAHRRISNLLLTVISELWGIPLPGNVDKKFKKKLAVTNGKSTSGVEIEKVVKPSVSKSVKPSQSKPENPPPMPKAENPPQKPNPKKKRRRGRGQNRQDNMVNNNWNMNHEMGFQPINGAAYNMNEQLDYFEQFPQEPYLDSFPVEAQLPVDNPNYHWQQYGNDQDYGPDMQPGPGTSGYHPYQRNGRPFQMQHGPQHMYQPEFW